jgi:hypothetical protein
MLPMALLSLVPLALTYPAWSFQRKLNPSLSRARLLLFRCGLLMSVLSAIAVASSWFNPFPLILDSQGVLQIRNSILFDTGLFASLLTIALAILGRGTARLLLAGSGFLLVIVAYGALLSNEV